MIKRFENYEYLKYNEDDYVLVDLTKIVTSDAKLYAFPTNYPDHVYGYLDVVDDTIPNYYTLFYINDKKYYLWFQEDEILRILTSDEIEEFEVVIQSNKYNL